MDVIRHKGIVDDSIRKEIPESQWCGNLIQTGLYLPYNRFFRSALSAEFSYSPKHFLSSLSDGSFLNEWSGASVQVYSK